MDLTCYSSDENKTESSTGLAGSYIKHRESERQQVVIPPSRIEKKSPTVSNYQSCFEDFTTSDHRTGNKCNHPATSSSTTIARNIGAIETNANIAAEAELEKKVRKDEKSEPKTEVTKAKTEKEVIKPPVANSTPIPIRKNPFFVHIVDHAPTANIVHLGSSIQSNKVVKAQNTQIRGKLSIVEILNFDIAIFSTFFKSSQNC